MAEPIRSLRSRGRGRRVTQRGREAPEQGTVATLDFGQRLLSLLDTGSFTTSYKYATLLALIDEVLATVGPDGVPPSHVSGRAVGRRVLALYWPQARPFSTTGPLRQSNVTGDIVSKVGALRVRLGIPEHVGLEQARILHNEAIDSLERSVEETVLRYPIPLLQRFGSGAATAQEQRFIYEYSWQPTTVPNDDRLTLVAGAGAALAALAGLIRPVVEREWLRFVARRNTDELDEFRVERFLFGADRIALVSVRAPLLDHQGGRCFYCQRPGGSWDVDHFIPWSRWPDDGLDNLVVAHSGCNNDKRASLASVDHLRRWWGRVEEDTELFEEMGQLAAAASWPRNFQATAGAARALYLYQPAGAMLWAAKGIVEALDQRKVRQVLSGSSRFRLAADQAAPFEL